MITDSLRINDPDVPGLSYVVTIEPDDDSRPDDDEVHSTPDMVEAFNQGDWRFVGVTVTPVVGELELAALHDSLWAVEHGMMPDSPPITFDTIIDHHPVPEMMAAVRERVASLKPTIDAAWPHVHPTDGPAQAIVIVSGTPARGFRLYGPYEPNTDECNRVTDWLISVGADWWHEPITQPTDIGDL